MKLLVATTQQAECLVPKNVAQAASHKAQKEEIPGNHRRQQGSGRVRLALQQHQGQGGEDAPEQCPPGHQDGVQLPAQLPHQHGVHRPAGGGTQGQKIAFGIQLQNEGAVADYQYHAGEGYQKAPERIAAEPLLPGKVGQDSGEDGGGGYDDADIGGQGISQGRVLRVKIKGAAEQTQQKEAQLLLPWQRQLTGPEKP